MAEGLYIPFLVTLLQDRNKIDEEKKFKSNTTDNEISPTKFSVILNIST